jgi:Protein of unknown function (DUF3005)
VNNAENNPTQSQQNEIQAKSPVSTPAQETSRADPATIAAEFRHGNKQRAVSRIQSYDPDPMPEIDLDSITADTPDPVQRANSRIVSVDSASMDASDNTVDTDGKGLEAMKGGSPMQDNAVGTNATLVNNIAAPSRGLGGIDSRPEGNLPQIALRHGWTMTYQGCTETAGRNGGQMEHLISIERLN